MITPVNKMSIIVSPTVEYSNETGQTRNHLTLTLVFILKIFKFILFHTPAQRWPKETTVCRRPVCNYFVGRVFSILFVKTFLQIFRFLLVSTSN